MMMRLLPCRRSRVRVSSPAFVVFSRGFMLRKRHRNQQDSGGAAPTLPPKAPISALTWLYLVALFALFVLVGSIEQDTATASSKPAPKKHRWNVATATWYGTGLYGNHTRCGQRYTIHTRGVAVPASKLWKYPCGTKFSIKYRGKLVHVRVIDTGSFSHMFDLSARTAMDLCRCQKPYTMTVRWKRGWK
jgi:hypothetical protein